MVAVTILLPIVFILLGFVPSKLPIWARLGIQILGAALIYFLGSETEFPLPMGDTLPMSSIFGGDAGFGEFAPISMGFACGVLGVVASLIGEVIRKVLGKKEESAA
ncbi:MAG: hypothetical protein HY319_02650 [Armatimonadetes bacterium]|nr:hypothetical protein [Armatimonadota bacterium]